MQKIELKIIISIVLFTIFIVAIQRYQLSESIIEEFQTAKKEKHNLLINTVTPIVSLDIVLGLEDAYNVYLDNIVLNNSDIDALKLLDSKKNVLYSYAKKAKTSLKEKTCNYFKKDIFDPLTGEQLAVMEFGFSNDDYEKIIAKSVDVTINIFMINFVLLIFFIFLIKNEFKALKTLTQNIRAYDFKKNNFPLEKSEKNDEISLIHNAIISMILKINSYSKELDEINTNLERKVRKRTEELEVQKLKAEDLVELKTNFLANMSHEIRTPMNAIIGVTHLMRKTDLDSKQKTYLKKINKVSNTLLIIINDILDFSKLEAGKLKIEPISFDMSTIVESLVYIFEDRAREKRLDFSIKIACKNLVFYGDSFRIEQVLINLISNALKFTHQGSISLIITCIDDGYVQFCVKDSGIGIKKKQKKSLFEAFTQADETTTREYGGTGLGLSISKQIVQQMKGKIWVESELGSGSEFIFILKLPQTDHVENPSQENPYMESLKILYTDPEEFKSPKNVISFEKRDVLFSQLLETATRKLPHLCEPIIEEIDTYILSSQDAILFNHIKMLFKRYKFKEIVLLLEQS